jgi:hypothetical protein
LPDPREQRHSSPEGTLAHEVKTTLLHPISCLGRAQRQCPPIGLDLEREVCRTNLGDEIELGRWGRIRRKSCSQYRQTCLAVEYIQNLHVRDRGRIKLRPGGSKCTKRKLIESERVLVEYWYHCLDSSATPNRIRIRKTVQEAREDI